MSAEFEEELLRHVQGLPPEEQRRVLDFARTLGALRHPNGNASSLRRFAGTITQEDLSIMKDAIRDGCERIDHDEW